MKSVYLVHVPKTAGNSIKKYLVADLAKSDIQFRNQIPTPVNVCDKINFRCLGHQNIFSRIDRTQDFTFSFVRNPWDRLVSAYFFLKQTPDGSHLEEDRKTYIDPHPDFGYFVQALYDHSDFYFQQRHLAPQHRLLTDPVGKLYVDFVGKTENLDHDFDALCLKLGLPPTRLDVVNRSEHDDYECYYNHEMAEMVHEAYYTDTDLFDYRY